MKRVVVNLDPEYLPWEENVVRLVRRRSKLRKAFPILLTLLLLAGVVGYFWLSQRAAQAGPALLDAGFAAVATVAPEGGGLSAPGGEIPTDVLLIAAGLAGTGIILLIWGILWKRQLMQNPKLS